MVFHAIASVFQARLYNICRHDVPRYGKCLWGSARSSVWSSAHNCKQGFAFYTVCLYRDLRFEGWLWSLIRGDIESLHHYSFYRYGVPHYDEWHLSLARGIAINYYCTVGGRWCVILVA